MTKIINSLLVFLLCLGFVSCQEDEEVIDPSASVPVIKFAFDELQADMNKVDNLPVVAVVQSEAGLVQVDMKILTKDETIEYKTVNEFFNEKTYNLAEKLNYSEDYLAFIVSATDKLERVTIDTLGLSVTGVVGVPEIKFEPEEIVYDELIGGPMPETHFTVLSDAGLKSLEMYLVTEEAQVPYGFPIDFSNDEKEYSFTEQVLYKEGDKGFKVKVTDVYGQTKIETMPVKYLTPAPPVVTLETEMIIADKDEVKAIGMQIKSQRGIKDIKIYRIEDGEEVLVNTIERDDSPASMKIAPEVTLTDATSGLKIVVTDVVDKSTEVFVETIVNMLYVPEIFIGSHPLANIAHDNYPGVFAMLSLKDMKTYSVDYALESSANASNVDLKFYCFGGSAVPRLYSIDGGSGTKSNEFKGSDGKSVMDMDVQNATRLLKLPGFDFDNATSASITRDIKASNITSTNVNPFEIGDVIAFKTAESSSVGGGRIGIIKILAITPPRELSSNNPTVRVATVSIKFPKE
ncbi:hypothetical protein SAMN05444274_103226 [Mariniphaga anaerophila]|uniref:Uncharacterized protein n=1 Tax=Mariniphaga anaerophila TaxID=1484053 RepID=A0A1M4Y4W5_9BACT|nr:hypothetical protein [Mariniphaga anaerophila]SHF00613.1 hypothetical protein SAMN05444274_103226 [Mariniphaga anaerophila]